jgi:hypothetical protein
LGKNSQIVASFEIEPRKVSPQEFPDLALELGLVDDAGV